MNGTGVMEKGIEMGVVGLRVVSLIGLDGGNGMADNEIGLPLIGGKIEGLAGGFIQNSSF